ncbi:MAG: zf-TFIIB domain-containing protein [Alphaproteobacteria bacterium]|nr:zf-TFIIB domain-containing protein [Alphaproteobacteria bacterium]
MKCPACGAPLGQKTRDGVEMEVCDSCGGMWLTSQELAELEDEVFDFGDDEKGSLMLGSAPSSKKCPQCGKQLQSFKYRLYELNMEFCDEGHGFWLEAGEDKRVLELMKDEEKNLGRKVIAEDRFAAHMRYLRSGSLLDKVRELTIDAIASKPKPRFDP